MKIYFDKTTHAVLGISDDNSSVVYAATTPENQDSITVADNAEAVLKYLQGYPITVVDSAAVIGTTPATITTEASLFAAIGSAGTAAAQQEAYTKYKMFRDGITPL